MGAPPLQVLLVEDEPAHAELIRRAFEDADRDVNLTVVETLEAAKNCVADSLPDLMFVDLLLPDGQGTELLPEQKEDARLPIIVITSFGNEQMAVDAMRTGALDYVVKSEAAFAAMPRIADRAIREWEMISGRMRAEEALQDTHRELEERVRERTAELAKVIQELKATNEQLEQEIAERKRMEENLRNDQKALRKLLEKDAEKRGKDDAAAEEEIGEVPEKAVDIPAEEAPDDGTGKPARDADDISLQEPPKK